MLSKFEQVQQQWGGNSDVIDQWLLNRQQLLTDYCKLVGLPPYEQAARQLPSSSQLELFCGQLVDYISAGHFKIYNMVMDRWNQTGFKATPEMTYTYEQIMATTDPLLNFNDKYAEVSEDDPLEDFDPDISAMGEMMEKRFDFEDQLIQLITESLMKPPGA
ncbi:sigma D regulator [Thaumasiovibrio subtropicus]|uniref:sigma D regulator n=1 Tax=Thaumasiovibrio subtropicus TaxID=1891207 RepID=UPI000B36217A|nr:sigma D regulator [Thaumasiovibrio subtropicus]